MCMGFCRFGVLYGFWFSSGFTRVSGVFAGISGGILGLACGIVFGGVLRWDLGFSG